MIRHPVKCRVFVGRQDELAALQEARRGLAHSRASVVLIGGEAGIGKSRLLAQFLRNAGEGRTRNVATAECLERAQQPFGPMRSFVSSLLGSVPQELYATKTLRALVQLAADDMPSTTVAKYKESPLETAELFTALVDFFKCLCTKRATILSIEDLHWADRSTLDFLNYLGPRISGTRFMLVATYRSEEVEENAPLFEAISRLSREATVRTIELEAFSEDEARKLMDGALQGAILPAATKSEIRRRCEGNPFFTEELLKSALEQPSGPDALRLPLSIRASILQRMSRLSEDDQRVLRYAAVLGYRFDPALLALAMNRNVDGVLPALHRARRSNIVIEEQAPRMRCGFRHALTRQIIYSDMLAHDLQRLHRQILATLESLSDKESRIEELAYHAWEAKDAVQTLEYNERAGDAALSLGANSEAATCFQRALDVASELGEQARLLERVGSVAQVQGRLQDAIHAFESALALRLRTTDYDDAARLVRLIAAERNNGGDAAALSYLEKFLEEHGSRLSVAARDCLLVFAARLTTVTYDFERVSGFLAAVRDPAALPPRVRQNYLLVQLFKHAYYGEVAAWERIESEFNDVLPLLPPFLTVIAQYSIGQSGCYLGANQQVERAFKEAHATAVQWGFSGLDAFGAAARAEYLWLRGRLTEARDCLEHVFGHPDIFVALLAAANFGPLIGLALDDDTLTERCLSDHVMRAARESAISLDSARIFGARATWLAGRGQLEEARSDLRLAIGALPRATPACATVLSSAARYLPMSELAAVVKLASFTALNDGDRAGHACALLVVAILAERSGTANAGMLANRAADAYRALERPLFEAQALELAGRLEEALRLYEACGAIRDVRRLSRNRATTPKVLLPHSLLSARELEVAQLATLGLTNTAIADHLAVGIKTVEKHLSSIYLKLGVRSRAQIAAVVVRERTDEPATLSQR